MKNLKVAAFVPLKLNSRRLPNKNFLRLGDRPLAYHIFERLLNVETIEKVYCYTSQPQIMQLLPEKIDLLMRPHRLDGDSIKANELFRYAVENIDADIIILCHATGPFIDSKSISKGLDAVISGNYDCAFSVLKIKNYAWFNGLPLNYNPTNMAQTQDLESVYVETSGFYIFNKNTYLEKGTRIGETPYMVEVTEKEAIDIDEPKDFLFAKHMIDYNPASKLEFDQDNFFIEIASAKRIDKNIRHVSFDLDGVLIDSIEIMEKAWKYCMQETSLSIPFEQYKRQIGRPFFDILHELGIPKQHHETITELYNKFTSDHAYEIEVTQNANELLMKLKRLGVKLSVVTSKSKFRTKEIMNHFFGNDIFDVIVTPEDIISGRGKPCPDPILSACATVGADPYCTLYVGDMDVDREAAFRAGTHFVYANWGYGDIKRVKDVWFNSLEDLVDYIESIVTL